MVTPAKTASKTKVNNALPVVYPAPAVVMYDDNNPLTVAKAMEYLGWEARGKDEKVGGEFALEDRAGRRVRLLNNVANRPLYKSNYESIVQEILNRRWKFNGETVIIGKHGHVLNGQHQLVALVLAEQDRTGPDKYHWEKFWDGPCTITKVVVLGVDESDATVNTMDTCKPRSLADVIYRSPFFAKLKSSDRTRAAGVTDYAIRTMWKRTAAKADAFAPVRTHSEALDFLASHKRLLEAVNHILEENKPVEGGEGSTKIGRYIAPGVAAAILYLMAASDTDPDAYRRAKGEKSLDMKNFDKACDFFTLLANDSPSLLEVRHAISVLSTEDGDRGANRDERLAVICKAWKIFKDGGRFTPDSCVLRDGVDVAVITEKDGDLKDVVVGRKLLGVHSVGGIDLLEPDPPAGDDATPAPAKAKAKKGGDGEADLSEKQMTDDIRELKEEYPDNTHFFKRNDGSAQVWGAAAVKIAKLLGTTTELKWNIHRLVIPADKLDKVVSQANVEGFNVLFVKPGDTYPKAPNKYAFEPTLPAAADPADPEPAEPTAADLAGIEADPTAAVPPPAGNGKAKKGGKKAAAK